MTSDTQRPAGASLHCPHSDLHFHLNNVGASDTNLHYLEITAKCSICDIDMVFRGGLMGISPNHPTCSVDGKEMRIPFLGEGEELTGSPIGYSIKAR